jgi:hypothetical protein
MLLFLVTKNYHQKESRQALSKADANFVNKYDQKLKTPMSQRYGGEEPSWGQWQKSQFPGFSTVILPL